MSFDLRCSIAQCVDLFEAFNRTPRYFAPTEPWIPAFVVEEHYPSRATVRMTERGRHGLPTETAIGHAVITLTGDGCRLMLSPASPETQHKFDLLTSAFTASLRERRFIVDPFRLQASTEERTPPLNPAATAPPLPQSEDYNTMRDFYRAAIEYYEVYEKPRGVRIKAFASRLGIEPNTFYKRRHELKEEISEDPGR